MTEAGPPNWRGLAALAVFIALLAGAFLILRPQGAPDMPKREPAPAPKAPALPAPQPALDRAELIEAAARAADAFATGKPFPPQNGELVGRRFALLIPFGCDGPGESGQDAFWTYDERRGTLRASIRPEDWTRDEIIRAMVAPLTFEAAEGFWISRPWIRTGDCPASPPLDEPAGDVEANTEDQAGSAAAPEPATEQAGSAETLALVEFFAPGSRRAMRRGGRPYRLTANVAPQEIDLSKGLRLLVEGRVNALPGGQPIACRGDTGKAPPLCLISVSINRVAVTDASGARVLSQWTD